MLLLMPMLAGPALAQKDAAEKVQEGNVNNWVEYYRKQREAAPQGGNTGAGEADKETRGKQIPEGRAKQPDERRQ